LKQCKEESDKKVKYGEASEDNLSHFTIRRLTFNPDFTTMMKDIIQFLNKNHAG
jgi:hypothetical protein